MTTTEAACPECKGAKTISRMNTSGMKQIECPTCKGLPVNVPNRVVVEVDFPALPALLPPKRQVCHYCVSLPRDVGCEICDPIQPVEVAEYQYRMRPTWEPAGQGWTSWNQCSPDHYADYVRVPQLHGWEYEVRRLCLMADDK